VSESTAWEVRGPTGSEAFSAVEPLPSSCVLVPALLVHHLQHCHLLQIWGGQRTNQHAFPAYCTFVGCFDFEGTGAALEMVWDGSDDFFEEVQISLSVVKFGQEG
jgi:hypothetical protein